MNDKKGFVLYKNQYETIKQLNNEQAGILFKTIFEYEISGEVEIHDQIISLVFTPIKQILDEANNKYESVCERNRINGLKGGRPKNPNNPSGFLENPKKPKKADIDIDIDIDIDNKKKSIKEKSFITPSIEEIQNYCKERNNNVNAEQFYNFYESKGWKVGNNKMKDWKACVRTWEQREVKPKEAPKEKFRTDIPWWMNATQEELKAGITEKEWRAKHNV